jgi:membrane fusion protein (multidrug efflux system)
VGQQCAVKVEGADRQYRGQVGEVSDVAEADGRTFKVRIVVIDPELPPGLRATAEVTIAEQTAALTIPAAAVQLADGDTATVFRVVGVKAQRVEVTIGLKDIATVEVIEGLTEGDTVVTEGASSLFDGAAVDGRSEP